MMIRARYDILLVPFVLMAWAAPAAAQWETSPYLGVNVAGNVERRKGGFGGSIAYFGDWMGPDGWVGLELDIQRYIHFFKDADMTDLVPDPQAHVDIDTDAWTVMGNVVISPFRTRGTTKWRPYGVAGLGLIRAMVDGSVFADSRKVYTDDQFDSAQNNLGLDVGAGVQYFLTKRFGLRTDLRYFRAFVDENSRKGGFFRDYGFWRTTIGVTFR